MKFSMTGQEKGDLLLQVTAHLVVTMGTQDPNPEGILF
jgi:hypothetical protein